MIRDIVFRGEVDLTNCDNEPIHIPGTIQPHGLLLGISLPGHSVVYCSQNVDQYFGIAPEQVLGKLMSGLLGEEEYAKLNEYLSNITGKGEDTLALKINAEKYSVSAHQSGEVYLLEIEPFPDGRMQMPDLYAQMQKFISYAEQAGSLKEFCELIAVETRALTGYDRVMIYRFDNRYNGEIYAESKRGDLEPFLGLHYPHTDIPAQARELYLKNLVRMIADVNYKPVPILAIDVPGKDLTLDLGLATLRSVSPIHIEYLKNMGVSATLTVSLVQNKKLWGLIACHHYSPHIVPHYTRIASKLLGHLFTSQIAVRKISEENDESIEIFSYLEQLVEIVNHNPDFINILLADNRFLQLTHAEGVAIKIEGHFYVAGKVPHAAELNKLAKWLGEEVSNDFYHTSNLASEYASAGDIADTAAGILYSNLDKHSGNCLIWFKPEMKTTINWAGDPEKAVVKVNDKERLSPRKSFALWKQNVSMQSSEWQKSELTAAARLASNIQVKMSLQNLYHEEEKYRKLSERLQTANNQLENFNWISSHDLKEPLRMISIYAHIIEKNEDMPGKSSKEAIFFMRQGVDRMNELINSLMEYNKVGSNSDKLLEPLKFKPILDRVLAETKDILVKTEANVIVDSIPEKIMGISPLIEQLLKNLIINASKFRDHQKPLVINIGARQKSAFWEFYLNDNGIGIDEQYAEKIFVVFQRIHTKEEFDGPGMGLAICKRIVEMHGGEIWVTSKKDVGSTFYFTLKAVNDLKSDMH
jgi:chemotaxis family two-component system sensor kinase Cph1